MEEFYKIHSVLCLRHSQFCDNLLKSLPIKKMVLENIKFGAGKSLKSPWYLCLVSCTNPVNCFRSGFTLIPVMLTVKTFLMQIPLYPVHIWISTIPVQFGSVRNCLFHTCSGRVPIHLSTLQTERTKLYWNSLFRNEPHKLLGLGSDRYGMSDAFTDVDRWIGTVQVPYRSKNASMDRVLGWIKRLLEG